DRMRNLMLEQQTYAPDPDFRITDYSLHPLALRSHAPRTLRLSLDSSREELFLDLIGGLPPTRPVQIDSQDDETRVELTTTNIAALFSWMIRNPGTVLKIGPREVHAEFETYLNAMRALHATDDIPSETKTIDGQTP
ncbi:MAG: hypothetical protein KDK34_00350, partial [Leptospiraceae bacterium]|nr:hypothetical protein [Leptospiraceae bacterium]